MDSNVDNFNKDSQKGKKQLNKEIISCRNGCRQIRTENNIFNPL